MHGPLDVKFDSYDSGVLTEIICFVKTRLNESSVHSVPFYNFCGIHCLYRSLETRVY
jgi:hypothetical protein